MFWAPSCNREGERNLSHRCPGLPHLTPMSQLVQALRQQFTCAALPASSRMCGQRLIPRKTRLLAIRAHSQESQRISPLNQLQPLLLSSAPHFSKARYLTVICSMFPVQCLYFCSQVCGLSSVWVWEGSWVFSTSLHVPPELGGLSLPLPHTLSSAFHEAVQALRPLRPTHLSTRKTEN